MPLHSGRRNIPPHKLNNLQTLQMTGMHLKCCGACADHFPSLAPLVAWRTDCVESASCRRQFRIAGQRSLPSRLPCCIHIKNDAAARLSVPQTADTLQSPSVGVCMPLEECPEGF